MNLCFIFMVLIDFWDVFGCHYFPFESDITYLCMHWLYELLAHVIIFLERTMYLYDPPVLLGWQRREFSTHTPYLKKVTCQVRVMNFWKVLIGTHMCDISYVHTHVSQHHASKGKNRCIAFVCVNSFFSHFLAFVFIK